MEAVARSCFSWPGLDKEVKLIASKCVTCQFVKNTPPSAPLHPLVWLSKPTQVLTDNGPQFVSDESLSFINGIKHIKSAPYHPATNGLAERFVQSLKKALKTNVNSGRPLSHCLANLFSFTIHLPCNDWSDPCSLFLKRQICTRLGPNQESHVTQKQAQQ